MTIEYCEAFTVKLVENHDRGRVLEDGLNSIGLVTDIASSCVTAAAILQEGDIPNDRMIRQIFYAASIITGLAKGMSDEMASEAMRLAKIKK